MEVSFQKAMEIINKTGKYGTHSGRENASHLLSLLGHPEKSLHIIHVAGTNGKGSVCSFLADMLTACGFRTGLFTSPHLVDARERIQIDRKWIREKDFSSCFARVQTAVDLLAEQGYTGITYFDYFFAVAMCYYSEQNVDYVVMETGLGGLLDSTNAINHPVLCIITSISFDHTEILGDTLAKIAAEKAGIIKSKTPLIYCANEAEVCTVVESAAISAEIPYFGVRRDHCKLISLEDGKLTFSFSAAISPDTAEFSCQLTVNSPALYQMENASIAYMAARYLCGQKNTESRISLQNITNQIPPKNSAFFWFMVNSVSETNDTILKKALEHSCWAGRMEQIYPNVYLDGAHNADGICMLLDSLRLVAKGYKVLLLFTAVKEKDTNLMIREICESGLFCQYYLTSISGPRAIEPNALKEQFCRFTNLPVKTFSSLEEAFYHGLETAKQQNFIFLIAGSLYLVGSIKELIS